LRVDIEAMTNAELAILGLIVEQPRHGYQIEQVIEERGMRNWTEIGFSSIYYLLKKLEREGLIEGHLEETEQGPARKVYRATPAGKETLRAGVLDALSVPRRCYTPLQLGLAHLPGIPAPEAAAALRHYGEALDTRLAGIRQRYEAQQPLPRYVELMFEHSITLLQAEMGWIDDLIQELEG
jgi:DNA-binding PadR family transcriptional regulator